MTRDMPEEIRAFIDRRAGCNHWRGEYPYDSQRKAQIASALQKLRCSSLDQAEAAIRKRHTGDPRLLRALDVSRDWSPG